ncbi:MAG: long-chain fatty acid transport protein [Myxococcales bacterium]|nr:long-chain fatty acid transport protein [Myxococcales bacterium]
MGGAATAASEDSSANYYNPAGLVHGRDLRIDIGYRYAQPILRMNGRDVGVDASRGFQIGIVAPGSIGPFRFAFGASLWLPDQRLTRVRSLPFDQPRFVLFDNRTQRLYMAANIAIQIVPGLYVGGGLTFMSRTAGQLFLKGDVAVSDPDASSLVSRIDVDLVAVRYPQLGVLWEPTPWLSIGVTYRHSFVLSLDQQFRIDGNIGNPGLPPVVESGYFAARSQSLDLFQPWQLTAGGALKLKRTILLTFDLTFARWSEFPIPASNLTLGLDIGAYNDRVMLPGARSYAESGFHDIVIPRAGVEWRAWERPKMAVDVRGGYSYEPTPVPEQIGESSFADSDKHSFSVGAGLELSRITSILPKPLAIDVHAAVTYLPERASHKVDPLDHTGDFVADGVVVQIGLMMRSRF